MKKSLFILAGLAALGGMGLFGTWVSAQNGGNVTPAAASAQPTLKIGLVNVVKVLKGFDKANYLGETLIKQAQGEEENLKNQDQLLKAKEAKIVAMTDKTQKEAAERAFADEKFRFSQLMLDYRKKYADKQGEMAVEVYDNISQVIDMIAKHKALELVLLYPDAASEKDAKTPAVAFQKLSPPAATVAWKHPGLDITDVVIANLNHYFKPPAGTTPPAGAAPGAAQPPPR